jgi:hypothetical protein
MKKTEFILIVVIILFSPYCISGQVFDSIPYYKKYTPKQLHKDLDFLFNKFDEVHPDYFAETPRDTVVKRYSELKLQIDKPMTRLDFVNLISPVIFSVIKDGHNYIYRIESDIDLYTNSGGKLFPFPVKIKERKLFVNSSIVEIPYNSEITHINGLEAKTIIEKILSGYNAESDHFEEAINSDWFSNAFYINYGGFENYEIKYISADETRPFAFSFKGRSQNDIDSLRFKFSIESYRFYEMPELNIGVIEYNACADLKNLRHFCDSVFDIMKEKEYKHLIFDIRYNLGGTSRTNELLMEYLTDKPIAGMSGFKLVETKVSRDKKKDFIYWNNYHLGWFKWYHYLYYPIYVRSHPYRKKNLTARNGTYIKEVYQPQEMRENPLRFSGNIYVLTSTKTYSAAASFAATIQCNGIGLIIGQETGQQTDFYAGWVGVTLPETKLGVAISTSRYVLPCSNNDSRGVIPDFIVEQEEITPELDVEMKYLKQLILGQE